MDYQEVRILVNKAIEIVDCVVRKNSTGGLSYCYCQLDELAFDQSFCSEKDESDMSTAIVRFSWKDDFTDEIGEDSSEIGVDDDNIQGAEFLAGMIYQKILEKDGLS